jgi:hypothetical protein
VEAIEGVFDAAANRASGIVDQNVYAAVFVNDLGGEG